MKRKPLVRKFFADSHTADGFHLTYSHDVGFAAKKLIILKHRSKRHISALLETIGQTMVKRGYNTEYFFCSSSPGLLDALAFPFLQTAVVDGYPPHIIDTTSFHCITEEINLGSFTRYKVQPKHPTLTNDDQYNEARNAACYFLAEAKLTLKHLTVHRKTTIDPVKLNRIALELLGSVLDDEPCRRVGKERHLLASAITAKGILNYYESILSDCTELYLLSGCLGSGRSEILATIYQVLRHKGLNLEVYHCALNPNNIDALYIPEKRLAIVKKSPYLPFDTNASTILYQNDLNVDQSSAFTVCNWKLNLLTDYENSFNLLLEKGIDCLAKGHEAKAKKEVHYHQIVDSLRFNHVKEEIIKKLLY